MAKTANYLYLDTETTGLSARTETIVEIAIVDDAGTRLMNSLVNPLRPIPFQATRVHGITDSMVHSAPTMDKLWPTIREILKSGHVVIYNAAFDRAFLPDNLSCAKFVSCAMLEFSKVYGEGTSRGGRSRWQKLAVAASHVGYRWEGQAHRALGDALACRAVWQWIRSRGHI